MNTNQIPITCPRCGQEDAPGTPSGGTWWWPDGTGGWYCRHCGLKGTEQVFRALRSACRRAPSKSVAEVIHEAFGDSWSPELSNEDFCKALESYAKTKK